MILSTKVYAPSYGQRFCLLVDKIEGGMPLTDVQIKRLKARADRYAASDGRGLALEVMPTGVAGWRYRYQFKGKTYKGFSRPVPDADSERGSDKRDEMATLVFRGESPARQKQLEKVALVNASTVR